MTKDHVLYDSIYTNIQKRQIYGGRKQISGCRWVCVGVCVEKWGIAINGYEDFFGVMKVFWNWLLMMVVQLLGV